MVKTCEFHGDYEAKTLDFAGSPFIVTRCPKCEAERKEREAAYDREEKERQNKAFITRAIERAKIPLRFYKKGFDDFKADTKEKKYALDVSRAYADNFIDQLEAGRCLIFYGKTGTGKTHLASCIAKAVIVKHFKNVIFSTAYDMISDIKACWNSKTLNEKDAIRLYTEPSLLIIDEIGIGYDSDSEKIILFNILNKRYEAVLPTIVMGNLKALEMKNALGDRIFDRFQENSGLVIPFDWETARAAK